MVRQREIFYNDTKTLGKKKKQRLFALRVDQ